MKKPVVKKDRRSGGYVAYYKHDLGIVSQGDTEEEAIINLKKDIQIINEFKTSIKEPNTDNEKTTCL